MFRRALYLGLATVMLTSVIACGNPSSTRWNPEAPETAGSIESLCRTPWVTGGMFYEFNEDGTFEYGAPGSTSTGDFTLENGILTVTYVDGNTFKGTFDGEKLRINNIGAGRVE